MQSVVTPHEAVICVGAAGGSRVKHCKGLKEYAISTSISTYTVLQESNAHFEAALALKPPTSPRDGVYLEISHDLIREHYLPTAGHAWDDTAWHDAARHIMSRYDMAWHGTAHGTARHGTTRCGVTRHVNLA